MRVRWGIDVGLIATIVLVATLAASCSRERERETTVTGWVPPDDVPSMLMRVSERTEDVIVAAAADNWAQVYAYVRDMSDAWHDYRLPTVVPLPEPRPPGKFLYNEVSAALARLQDAATARQTMATMRAANDVDAAVAELHTYYHPRVPPSLLQLRALERRIVLDAAEGRLHGTAATLRQARSAWEQAREAVAANTTSGAAAALDRQLDAQQEALAAGDAQALGDHARQAVDLIRQMERLTYYTHLD